LNAVDDIPLKKKKRKLLGKSERISTDETEMPNVSPPSPPKAKKQAKRPTEKHSAKQANLAACNAAAKSLFAQADIVKKLEAEIARLHQQLQDKEQVLMKVYISTPLLMYYTYMRRRKLQQPE